MRLAIDIGTHTARAAYLGQDGAPRLVRFASGQTAISAFARQTMHGLDVGDDAARSLVGNEETTLCGCTRLMGRARLLDAELLGRLPYSVRAIGGEAWCNLLYDEVRVSDVYGRIAANLIDMARQQIAQPVESVVVCIPASAEDRFRVQARTAIEASGVRVARLINQPAAALIALEAQQRRRTAASHVAVVACGGGTTEVSLARRDRQGIRTLATVGDVLLGGDDLVWAAAQALNQRLQHVNGVDVFAASQSRAAAYGLRAALEETLSHLTIAPHAALTLDHGAGFGRDVVTSVSRADAETWFAPLLSQIAGLCQRAMTAAGLQAFQVEQVVLIGEWAWLPGIATTIAQAFGQPVGMLHTADAASLAVRGAALAGAANAPTVWDVTPYPLGINCYYGTSELFSPIIAANTPIPTPMDGAPGAFTESYQTRYPDQTSVTLSVLQYRGDRDPDPRASQSVRPADCETLGAWEWKGLRPKRGRHADFTVTFTVDADGILHLYAREKTTGHSLAVQVEGQIG